MISFVPEFGVLTEARTIPSTERQIDGMVR